MTTSTVRTPIIAFGFFALFVAIGLLAMQNKKLQKKQVVFQYPPRPCSPSDTLYGRYKVKGVGVFCIEKKTKDMIKSFLKEGLPWERHIKHLLRRYARPGSTVVDIGAHIGTHTLLMSQAVGPKGQVVAFEPQVKIYQELLVNLQLNQIKNVQAHFVALGEKSLRITMSYPKPENEGAISIGRGGNIVELRPLDSFHLENVSLIKIDVEGAEVGVLKGADKTIRKHRPVILIEILGGIKPNEYTLAHKKHFMKIVRFFKARKYALGLVRNHDYIVLPMESKAFQAQMKMQRRANPPKRQHPTTKKAQNRQ